MPFNSFPFLVFLALVLTVYYPLPHRYQNHFLLAASAAFYAAWDWRFLAPLLLTTSLDYYCATRMVATSGPRRPWLILSVCSNLGLLAFFKYFNFFSPFALRIILPLGISFYTFQALSYTIDVYRGELHPTRSYPDFLLAVLYFPHLIAGPIQRAHNLLPQVSNPRHPTYQGITEGLHLIVWGYFKKVCIADNLAPLVNGVFAEPHPAAFHVLLAAYAFAFQIYCDFSGYTDIARGIAKLMGFEFVLNFRLPYFASGPQEFWSRWHISLSTWLRDYLYKPLGGNRRGPARTCANLMLTMVLGGLWHGAAWTFILWGFYHGLLLVLSKSIPPRFTNSVPLWLRVFAFFHLTCYGWLIFRATSLAQLGTMTAAILTPGTFDTTLAGNLLLLIAPVVAVQIIQQFTKRMDFLSLPAFRCPWLEVRTVCYAAMLYLTLFRGGPAQSFIYFQF